MRQGTAQGAGPLLLGCAVFVFPSSAAACAAGEAGESLIFLTRKAEYRDAFGIAVVRHLLASPDNLLDRSSAAACSTAGNAVIVASAEEDKSGSFHTKPSVLQGCASGNSWSRPDKGGAVTSVAAGCGGVAGACASGSALEGLVTALFNQLQGKLDLHIANIDSRIDRLLTAISPQKESVCTEIPAGKSLGAALPKQLLQCYTANCESLGKDSCSRQESTAVQPQQVADASVAIEERYNEELKSTFIMAEDSLTIEVQIPSACADAKEQQHSHTAVQNGRTQRQYDNVNSTENFKVTIDLTYLLYLPGLVPSFVLKFSHGLSFDSIKPCFHHFTP
jgi:hypothetical protein